MRRKFRFFRASVVAPLPAVGLWIGCMLFVAHDPGSDKASVQTAQLLLHAVTPVLFGVMAMLGYVGSRLLALVGALSPAVLVALAVAVGLLFGGAAALSGSLGKHDAVITFAVIGGGSALALVLSSLLWWWVATRGAPASAR